MNINTQVKKRLIKILNFNDRGIHALEAIEKHINDVDKLKKEYFNLKRVIKQVKKKLNNKINIIDYLMTEYNKQYR